MLLSGTVYSFKPLDDMLVLSVDGSLGYWHSKTATHNSLLNASVYGAFRAYFRPIGTTKYSPYLLMGFGPSYLSNEMLGENKQGSHFDFQTSMGAGLGVKLKNQHQLLFSYRFVHLCNAGLAKPNKGFNLPFILSIGYTF